MKKEIKNENVNLKEESLIDKDIQTIIDNQYETTRRLIKEQRRKEQRNQKILQVIMIIVILITLVLICIWNYKLQKDFTKNCMNEGYNENYCISKS